jgi:hypothetical protein
MTAGILAEIVLLQYLQSYNTLAEEAPKTPTHASHQQRVFLLRNEYGVSSSKDGCQYREPSAGDTKKLILLGVLKLASVSLVTFYVERRTLDKRVYRSYMYGRSAWVILSLGTW